MILITDSNIIYSALIKPNGVVASIFKEKSHLQFIAPDYLFFEVKKNWDKIVKYSDLSEKELKEEFHFYKEKIKSYDVRAIGKRELAQAEKIVEDIDPDDVFFIALHLHLKHKIWCSDNVLIQGLTEKGYGHFFVTTQELKKKRYKRKGTKQKG